MVKGQTKFFKSNSSKGFSNPPGQSKGILADDVTRTVVRTKEGEIEHPPINNNHIVNKLYVDNEIITLSGSADAAYVNVTGDTMTGSLTLPSMLINATPDSSPDPISLAFGDGDTGFYEATDDNFKMIVGDVILGTFTPTAFTIGTSSISKNTATATVPSILPRFNDTNTGVGWAGLDQLSLIAGGNETLQLTTTGAKFEAAQGSAEFLLGAGGDAIMILDSLNDDSTYIMRVGGNNKASFGWDTGLDVFRIYNYGTSTVVLAVDASTGDIEIKGGDFFFTGDSTGLPYGNCYGDHIEYNDDDLEQNTWYQLVDDSIASGELNLVTHNGNGALTVLKAGRYLINFDISYEMSAANVHVEFGISVGDADPAANSPHIHTTSKFLNQEQQNAGSGILDLATDAIIEIAYRTTDVGTPDIFVDNMHLTCVMVGGT